MGKPTQLPTTSNFVNEQSMINQQLESQKNNVQSLYGYSSSGSPTKGLTPLEDKSKLSKLGGRMQGALGFSHNQTVISSGSISLDDNNGVTSSAKSFLSILTESALPTDTLDNITGRKYEGQILIITNGLSGSTITLTDGAGGVGGMACPDGVDLSLPYPNSAILIDDPTFGTQTWRVIGTAIGGGATALNNLSDVTITAASNNDILKYNGSAWVNSSTGVFTTLSATSSFSSTGSTTLGDNTADPINFVGRVNTDFVPKTDNAHDLGSATREWKDLYIDGTANIDNLQAGIGAFTTSLSSTGLTTLGDNATDSVNIVGNVDTDIHIDGGNAVKAYDSQEIALQVTNDSITTGTEGTIQLPWLGSSSTTKAAADTDFGNATACCGINEIGGTPTFLVRKSDGSWWGVALSSFFP
jgi:hypothetical protein